MNNLSIDEHFNLLLYKKIMNKTGSAKRRAKKYYKDHYKKTGIIPALLMLAEKGIMEGRKCSGRPRSIDEQTKRRFISCSTVVGIQNLKTCVNKGIQPSAKMV